MTIHFDREYGPHSVFWNYHIEAKAVMIRRFASIALFASVAIGARSYGQAGLSADVRLGAALPTQSLAGIELKPGTVVGATIAYQLQSYLHVYAGWDWAHFSADQPSAGAARDYDETGYTLGLRFEHPFRETTNWGYRFEAGGTYKHIEMETANGDIVANSGHGPGYEIGAALLVPLSANWRLVPALRMRSLSRDIANGAVTKSGSLRYAAFEIGTSFRF